LLLGEHVGLAYFYSYSWPNCPTCSHLEKVSSGARQLAVVGGGLCLDYTTGSCNSIEVKSCDVGEVSTHLISSSNNPIVRVSHATLTVLLHKPRSAWLHGG
jgi:hypothetical protein